MKAQGSPEDGGFSERRRLYAEMLVRFLGGGPRLVLLTDMPGNTGDHLIWAGSRRLLEGHSLPFDEIPVAHVLSGAEGGGTLVIPGSGAFVRKREQLPGLICAASERFERVVILPSSYDPTVPVVAKALAKPNVYPFAREPVSYRAIKDLGRAVLAFDPALYAWDFVLGPRKNTIDEDQLGLVSLRTDADSVLNRAGLAVHPGRNDDLSVSSANLEAFIQRIRTADRIVTDRLQVVVAGIMVGTSVDYIDPYDRKISTYLEFTFGRQVTRLVEQRDLLWLLQAGLAVPMKGV